MNVALLVIGVIITAGIFVYIRSRGIQPVSSTPIATGPTYKELLDAYQDAQRKAPAPSVANYDKWRTDYQPWSQGLFDSFNAYRRPLITPR